MLTAVAHVNAFEVVGVSLGVEVGAALRWGFVVCFESPGGGAVVS